MTASVTTHPAMPLLEEFEAQADKATLATYSAILRGMAVLQARKEFSHGFADVVIRRLASNSDLPGKRKLDAEYGDMMKEAKRDNSEPSQDGMVQGGQGMYYLKDGWLFRSTEKGDYKVCTGIEVLGRTRNTEQSGWGKLLQWQDGDGKTHTWAMPMRLMSGDGNEVIGALLDRGLSALGGASKYIADYLQAADTDKRLMCVEKTGWYDGRVFVTPSNVYGDDDDSIIYQGAISASGQRTKGTLEGWRDEVARLAIGNSRLAFAISSAFAPALLDIAPNVGTGGFQYTGSSKDGKTLVLRAAASVHGYHKDVKQQWRGTINGIESLAARHNDGWLFLDEQGMASAHEVERIIYMLAEGKDKAKQTRNNDLKRRTEWKMLWFSSGEISAAEHIATKGSTPPAGIELRQADIPADAGKGFKAHDTIHNHDDLNAFNTAIGEGIENHYGLVGQEWLATLATQRSDLDTRVPEMLETAAAEIGGSTSSPQTRDVLYRCALVAVAGELATEYGLTGWTHGDATASAKRVFTDWLKAFGGDDSNREQRQIVDAVRAFLNSNMSRFQNRAYEVPKEELERVRDCVGGVIPAYDDHSQAVFVVFNSQIKELAKGYSKSQILDAMEQAGMIQPPINGGREYIPGHGRMRVTRIIANDGTDD